MVYLQIHQAVVRIPTADWPTQHRPMFPIPAVEQWRRAVRPAGCCRQRKCPKGQQSQRFPIHKDTQQLKIVNYTYFNITNAIIHIHIGIYIYINFHWLMQIVYISTTDFTKVHTFNIFIESSSSNTLTVCTIALLRMPDHSSVWLYICCDFTQNRKITYEKLIPRI